MVNGWLIVAAILDAMAALVHLACIVGGGPWYRAMGAGERMTRAVEREARAPHLLTIGIAAVLMGWCAYALSGAGVIFRLPLLRPVLVSISVVYLCRAAALPVMMRTMPDRSRAFLLNSSFVVLLIGATHAIGVCTGWRSL